MGLTHKAVGRHAIDTDPLKNMHTDGDTVIALAGNPNVGKSTIFNGLTGMNQHTGNWPGKTVSVAKGYCKSDKHQYVFIDIPGTYSLMAHSAEEAVARDFLCFGQPNAVVVVCDATCLERNLNLVLQTLEITSRAVVCVNLLDEATKKHIRVDLKRLSKLLGVPVVGTSARQKEDLSALLTTLDRVVDSKSPVPLQIQYDEGIESAVTTLIPHLSAYIEDTRTRRWIALRLLDHDTALQNELSARFPKLFTDEALSNTLDSVRERLNTKDATEQIVSALMRTAEDICRQTVSYDGAAHLRRDRRIDRVLTGKWTAYPCMLILLAFVFWLTIVGANDLSALLSTGLFWIQDKLTAFCRYIGIPSIVHDVLILGIYRVVAWVVSVMLPPMAIFFPLFTLLEDVGYLPRIAYNLDRPFHTCNACGKQALTMCMSFGCNAAGVVGARIIDSPRERLLAILTNNFIPCNGRFPTLITLITLFFITTAGGLTASLASAVLLTVIIAFAIGITLLVTRILSKTLLKGVASSFTLELPPYRTPQVGKVIWRSMCDRAVFVLGRAVAVAAPAGLILWIFANISLGGQTLLTHAANVLDPFATLMGLDGVILLAFILGFPANEIVIPIILMAYTAGGTLTDTGNLLAMKDIFLQNGWTWETAISVMLFSIMHWPCSTTLLTIKKETGSIKWTVLSALIPTALGILTCILFTQIARLW